MNYPEHLKSLIANLKRLPGVGNKTAERFAFQMIDWKPHHLQQLADCVKDIPEKIHSCPCCGCLMDADKCLFCHPSRALDGVLCIVASARDVFAIESTHEYHGMYHVLGGHISPMEGIGPEQLNVSTLQSRIENNSVKEIIIALDSTLEGDATALWLKSELEPLTVKVSRLAFGLPMGSSLDYIDGGTLAKAFSGRSLF
ncbi:MAG: recombination protein RecR [Chlamydiales bacterium]|nr:recombination protein RecR [Chlamydiia bacterium]MCP5507320.1 recombination protein RecR [Chlamydiales bacterium]